MKLLSVFITISTVVSAGHFISIVPGDNHNYIEGVSRYVWMADGDGVQHLVDLQSSMEDDILPNRNGGNNQYWLYTRSNPTSAQIITHEDEETVMSSNYNSDNPLSVVVHGWNSDGNSRLNPELTSALLSVQDANVIVVDWSHVAYSIYISATRKVPEVGVSLGDFLTWLIDTTGGDWHLVHIIGFSLGAHVVGNAGRTTAGKASRITGLDPAGPLFSGSSHALTSSDAQYVEVIHTDGGFLGLLHVIGHADFYPNGGRHPQPGCLLSSCSHGRAPELMAASIQYDHLVGRECTEIDEAFTENCVGTSYNMGNSILTKRGYGIFGLTTGSNWPF